MDNNQNMEQQTHTQYQNMQQGYGQPQMQYQNIQQGYGQPQMFYQNMQQGYGQSQQYQNMQQWQYGQPPMVTGYKRPMDIKIVIIIVAMVLLVIMGIALVSVLLKEDDDSESSSKRKTEEITPFDDVKLEMSMYEVSDALSIENDDDYSIWYKNHVDGFGVDGRLSIYFNVYEEVSGLSWYVCEEDCDSSREYDKTVEAIKDYYTEKYGKPEYVDYYEEVVYSWEAKRNVVYTLSIYYEGFELELGYINDPYTEATTSAPTTEALTTSEPLSDY